MNLHIIPREIHLEILKQVPSWKYKKIVKLHTIWAQLLPEFLFADSEETKRLEEKYAAKFGQDAILAKFMRGNNMREIGVIRYAVRFQRVEFLKAHKSLLEAYARHASVPNDILQKVGIVPTECSRKWDSQPKELSTSIAGMEKRLGSSCSYYKLV